MKEILKKLRDALLKETKRESYDPVQIPERGFVLTKEGNCLFLKKEFHCDGLAEILQELYPEESEELIPLFETDSEKYIAFLQDQGNVVFKNYSIIHFGDYQLDPSLIEISQGNFYLPGTLESLSLKQREVLSHYVPDFQRMDSLSIFTLDQEQIPIDTFCSFLTTPMEKKTK